jgi:nicotinamidase-related amidase
MKPALLVIDVQKEFYKYGPAMAQSMDYAIYHINDAIALFRAKGLPVISIQHINVKDNLVPGTEGFELPEKLQVLPSDLHIHKTYGNAFNKTPLTEEIRKLGVDTVVVCGAFAEHCVLSPYRGARDLDLTPIVLKGGGISFFPEHIRFVETISDTASLKVLEKALE